MRTRLIPLLLLPALAVGCSSDGSDSDPTSLETTSTPSPSASPTPPSSPTPSATSSFGEGSVGEDDEEPATRDEQAFVADRAQDTAEATGNGLSVVDVRTGRHDGYDRVVFELDGDGTPGWSVQYDDNPATQGEGAPVDVEGAVTLAVTIMGVGYPSDTGVQEYCGPRTLTPALPVVREVQLGGVFEGYYDAFVGVAQERPFRVFRLEDPARVVLDVAHGG